MSMTQEEVQRAIKTAEEKDSTTASLKQIRGLVHTLNETRRLAGNLKTAAKKLLDKNLISAPLHHVLDLQKALEELERFEKEN